MKRSRSEMMEKQNCNPLNPEPTQNTDGLTKNNLNTNVPLTSVPLTFLEKKLFDLLLDVAKQPNTPPVTLRVAGGWVRDKILSPGKDLGTEVDIDIALDTMLGIEFAERVKQYLTTHHMKSGSVGLIQKNPDQSKHLETATMRVMGVALDFVNLRTETYTHDSRIPNIKIGSPLEDAMRRDLTINALFYNINTGSLEDFTGKAFDDIRARMVRTPLTPLETLLDDPLRALRAIRFASRLNFEFEPALFEACRDTRVHEALGAKVSRERISAEVDRVIASKNAPHAIGLFVELGLFNIVFRLPPAEDLVGEVRPPNDLPEAALGALLSLQAMEPPKKCAAARRLTRYAAILSPLAECHCIYAENGKRRKELPVSKYMLRSELRLSGKDVYEVCEMLESSTRLKSLVHKEPTPVDRMEVGFAIRNAGAHWRSALQIALVTEIKPPAAENTYATGVKRRAEISGSGCKVLMKKYMAFEEKVDSMGLDGVWDIRPMVNGNDLQKLLPNLQRGPLIGTIMNDQISWQMENPSKDDDDLKVWLKTKYAEYR